MSDTLVGTPDPDEHDDRFPLPSCYQEGCEVCFPPAIVPFKGVLTPADVAAFREQASKAFGVTETVITYYISGPMRGKPGYNYDQFNEVDLALREDDSARVLNPAANFGGDKTRPASEYMQADMVMVLSADVIVLLPDWRTSEGARREVQLGIWTGKRFEEAKHDEAGWSFTAIPTPTLDESPRGSALDEAKQLITGDRNNAYGPPTQDFDRTAAMASAFGFEVNGRPLKGHHVAIFMMLLKVSRLAWTPGKRDSWVDAAGYAGCGFECATVEAENG